MRNDPDSPIKVREIAFCPLHPDRNQAGTAVQLLRDCEGVLSAERLNDRLLRVSYDLHHATLAAIEELLEHFGFHLDNSLLQRMRRALVKYTEETQRSNLGCGRGTTNCTVKVFINSYRQRAHGCQDGRPQHWRRYL
ncbi:MAG TPA: hypothetical protein ENJ94_07930 [Gammaproteobacteria bacterium]|nr:hypothetical protein [Gammaproteobacteria bacterium]